mmetsp:Transcript_12165/g.20504  ORF Transcript_12165/g.20504 Transcript_12165/m.20504 type:complete len:137 (-) Transcript_12165:403-813(-)
MLKRRAMNRNYLQIMEEKIVSKEHMEFEEDFHSMTVLCYLKENQERLLLTTQKMSHNFSNLLIIFGVQILMVTCMLVEIVNKDEFSNIFIPQRTLLMVKLPCAIALHLHLYPEVHKGMVIMKFANNQPELFINYGS